jgi:hypothetical protein
LVASVERTAAAWVCVGPCVGLDPRSRRHLDEVLPMCGIEKRARQPASLLPPSMLSLSVWNDSFFHGRQGTSLFSSFSIPPPHDR